MHVGVDSVSVADGRAAFGHQIREHTTRHGSTVVVTDVTAVEPHDKHTHKRTQE